MSSGTAQAARGRRAEKPLDLRARLRLVAPSDVKLHVPAIRAGIVARAGLVDRARNGEPVVVISAPAGYGKTTLLSQWALVEQRPFAFLTVTEGDNDLAVFVAYIIRALDAVDPLLTETLAAFVAPGADGPTVLLPRLGRALLDRPNAFVLAIDDLHLLSDPDCVKALEVLVSHLPAGSQLALASRQDPPLARARMRTRRTLVEICAEDLKLTPQEGAAVLRDAGVDLDEVATDSLVERTEGWAAGIYLAALAVRDLEDASAASAAFSGDHLLVAEFLRHELLDGLPDEVVEFLTRTSVLEYLDGPGCDAVLNRSDSWSVLEELARSNLFVVPLDASGEQYRYHHLFADLLQVELRRREPDLERALHLRASALFAGRGQPNLAIEHARRAGDITRAVALLWQSAPGVIGAGRSATVERWLAPFSPEEFQEHPSLAITAAWCCVSARQIRPIGDWIGLARRSTTDDVLPDGTPLAAAVALLDAVACERGLRDMADAAGRSRALDRESSVFAPTAAYLEGSALLLLGRLDDAQVRFDDVIRTAMAVPGAATGSLAQLALIAVARDSWDEAEHLMARAMATVEEHRLEQLVPQVLVFAVSAYVQAHRGDVTSARRTALHARRLLAQLNHIAIWLAIESRVVLARVDLLLGEVEAARLLVQEARDLVFRVREEGVLPDQIRGLAAAVDASASAESVLGAAPLTTAELRVLSYLPTHLSFQAIAQNLFVSRNTVKTQAISIYRKLGVSSRGDAVARARELGLLES